jgi:hypothetical protein
MYGDMCCVSLQSPLISAFAPMIHNFLMSCFSMQSPCHSVPLLIHKVVVLCSKAHFGSDSCRNFRHVWCCEIVSVLIAVLFRTHTCCHLTSPARQRVIGAEFVPPRRALTTAARRRCTPLLLFHKLC